MTDSLPHPALHACVLAVWGVPASMGLLAHSDVLAPQTAGVLGLVGAMVVGFVLIVVCPKKGLHRI